MKAQGQTKGRQKALQGHTNGAPRVPGERRVVYYLGDVASDIAKRRAGNAR